MRFLNNIKMKRKLVFSYMVIVIVPILVIGYFLTNKLNSVSFSGTMQLSNATMNQLRGNFINKLLYSKDIADTLVNDVPLRQYINTYYQNDFEALEDYINRISPLINRLTYKENDVIIKVYTNNETIGFSGETNNTLKDLRRQSWYDPEKAMNSSLSWTTTHHIAGGGDRNYLGCYRVLRDDADLNKINAVIAVFLEEGKLYSLISEERAGGKVIFLYDDRGKIITSTERQMIYGSVKDLAFIGNRSLEQIASNSIVNYKGNSYAYITVPISNQELAIENWKVIYMVPANQILGGISGIWVSSFILCFVCFIFSLAILLSVSNSITVRLSDLVGKINKVKEGNFRVAALVSGTDEIAAIETNFNSMVEQIDRLINEVYKFNIRIRDAEINNQKVQMEKKEAEIIALQGQINPHYLFNTLETIRMNLIIKEDRETAHIVKVFSESFRACMDNKQEIYTLREELQLVEKYFIIQKYRFGDKIDFQAEVSDDLLDCFIPKLLIQPLAENAVYHGLELKLGEGVIRLSAAVEGENLVIQVADDGVGIGEEELETIKSHIYRAVPLPRKQGGSRVALRNVHSRLRLMFGEEYGLRINSGKNQGTVVEIRMPVLRADSEGDHRGEGYVQSIDRG